MKNVVYYIVEREEKMSIQNRNKLSEIMRKAWFYYNKSENNAFEYIKKSFSECLKKAWRFFKNQETLPEFEMCFDPMGI